MPRSRTRTWVVLGSLAAFVVAQVEAARRRRRSPGTRVVATANYVARRFGIHSAMSCAEARRRCPHAVFVRPRHKTYSEYSKEVWNAVRQVVPTVERTGLDEGYLNLEEVARDFGEARIVAEAVQTAVRGATSLTRSLGVSTSKVVARFASDFRKPGGLVVVLPGREAEFLAPFEIRRLPGVGPRAEARLRAAGIETVGALAVLEDEQLRQLLQGKIGGLLRDRACGIDPRGLETQTQRVSINQEETFERDVADVEQLRAELRRMSSALAEHLVRKGETARTVTTKVRYPDFAIRSRSTSLPVGPARCWTGSRSSPARSSTGLSPTGPAPSGLSAWDCPAWRSTASSHWIALPTMNRQLIRALVVAGTLLLLAVAAFVGKAWYDSRLPGTYNVMDYGTADYGGGPTTGHDPSHGRTSVRDLAGPTGAPDVRVELTARKAEIRLDSGKTVDALTFDGQVPGPEIRVKQHDLVEVTLLNEDIDRGVAIHWHGIDLPNREDGVAGVTQDAVLPGGRYTYRFRADQLGTFWYHSHQDAATQVARGLYGVFVIEPRMDRPTLDLAIPLHTFGNKRVFGTADGLARRPVPAGREVRLRLVNTDDGPRASFFAASASGCLPWTGPIWPSRPRSRLRSSPSAPAAATTSGSRCRPAR